MIDKQAIANLRLVHGAYNTIVMFLLMYQGLLGLKIRRERKAGIQTSRVIRRHRKFGPILVFLGILGFFAGAVLVYIDYGDILKYPLHLITGLAIVFAIISTFLISRKIKGTDSAWRTPHFRLGILIICLYAVQVFIGMGILL